MQLALDKRTKEQVAIKFLKRGGGASQRVIARELLNHRECALHPNIVQLKVRAGGEGGREVSIQCWTRRLLTAKLLCCALQHPRCQGRLTRCRVGSRIVTCSAAY